MPSTLRGRSVFAVLLVALLSALPMRGASAHSELIGSTPSRGQTISALPAQIELRFNYQLSDLAPALILRHDDTTVAELQPSIDGMLVRADAPQQELADGSYQLSWRIVSVDGHPLSGSIPFVIGGDQAAATEAPLEPQAPPQSSSNKTVAVVLGIVPIVLLGLLLLRRRSTRSDTPKESS